jgi:hypothetical protein
MAYDIYDIQRNSYIITQLDTYPTTYSRAVTAYGLAWKQAALATRGRGMFFQSVYHPLSISHTGGLNEQNGFRELEWAPEPEWAVTG